MTYDPAKRERTREERGLDFEESREVFAGTTITVEDRRRDYGGTRFITIGFLRGRMVVLGWTPRGEDRHVFSMRKANDREQSLYRERLGEG